MKMATKKQAVTIESTPKTHSAAERGKLGADQRLRTAAVRAYLNALNNGKPSRRPLGKRTPEFMRQQLAEWAESPTDDVIEGVRRAQLTLDYTALLAELEVEVDMQPLEDAFVKHAKEWADRERYPVSWKAFRDVGVPAEVLAKAGIEK